MKIALIVPFKNAKAWLPRCLKSIDPRFELILVDDHRDDKEICEAIRIRQSELWINPTYKRAIGGAK